MPFVTIVLREGRSVEQKREMVKAVTEAIARTVGAKPEATASRRGWAPMAQFRPCWSVRRRALEPSRRIPTRGSASWRRAAGA